MKNGLRKAVHFVTEINADRHYRICNFICLSLIHIFCVRTRFRVTRLFFSYTCTKMYPKFRKCSFKTQISVIFNPVIVTYFYFKMFASDSIDIVFTLYYFPKRKRFCCFSSFFCSQPRRVCL